MSMNAIVVVFHCMALFLSSTTTSSFQLQPVCRTNPNVIAPRTRWTPMLFSEPTASSSSSRSTSTASDDPQQQPGNDPLGLTPELRRMTDAFEAIGDDKLRYKQLLYMANQLPALAHPDQVMIPENKVPGCLSAVYVDGTAVYDESKHDYIVSFVGDSDGLLTKGLVALLVRGLSGNTAEAIQNVNPVFIEKAKISQSLTPGRNNGFLNMLSVMKKKAIQLTEQAKQQQLQQAGNASSTSSPESSSSSSSSSSDRPMYHAIVTALQALQPTMLHLVDRSDQHAGHEGSKGYNGESHFDLEIVAEAFDGLSLVKRHQLIYMMLGQVMPKIHALQIKALTPQEASRMQQ